MAVKIRLQRGGAKHAPYYRVVVADSRKTRDGRFVEKVGIYDPKNKVEDKQLELVLDRIDYWLSVGAQPSDTVRSLIKRARKHAPAEKVEKAEKAEKAEVKPAKQEEPAKEEPVKEETVAKEEPAEEEAAKKEEPAEATKPAETASE